MYRKSETERVRIRDYTCFKSGAPIGVQQQPQPAVLSTFRGVGENLTHTNGHKRRPCACVYTLGSGLRFGPEVETKSELVLEIRSG